MNTLGYINSYLLKKLYANLKATIALLTPASPIRQAKIYSYASSQARIELLKWFPRQDSAVSRLLHL